VVVVYIKEEVAHDGALTADGKITLGFPLFSWEGVHAYMCCVMSPCIIQKIVARSF